MLFSRFACCAVGVVVCLSPSFLKADTDGVVAPTEWDRNDDDAGFAVFDIFSGGFANGVTSISPSSADIADGGLAGTISQPLPIIAPGMLFGAPNDNRLYAHFSEANWSIDLTSANFNVNSVQLQVKEAMGIGLADALLDGDVATSTNVYDDGNGNAITSFSWSLGSTIAANTPFSVSLFVPVSQAQPKSFDSFTIDASATVTAVPEPSFVGLMVASMLIGVGRRVRR